MVTIREKKRRRIWKVLLYSPLTLLLIVINIVLVSWLVHILHVIFTDALDHMTLYEWTAHLYSLAKYTFEEFFASVII